MKLLLLACSSLLLVLLASQPASAGVEYFLDYFRAECENRGYPGGGTVTYCDVKLDVSGYGLWRIGKCTRKFFTDSCHVVTRKNLVGFGGFCFFCNIFFCCMKSERSNMLCRGYCITNCAMFCCYF